MTLDTLNSYLEQLLAPHSFKDYCFNGIQVRGKEKIQRVAFAVSASLEAIEQAIAGGADALIVHHGLFWHKDPHQLFGVQKEKVKALLMHDISLLAYHLPLDAHQEIGNNWKVALDLNWQERAPFGLFQGTPIGVKGVFSPMPIEAFIHSIESYYNHAAHRALGGKKEVRSAALISGGAHRSIDEAIQEGVDCFITGSFDEPTWYQALEGKVHFLALGHSATEKVGPRALALKVGSDLNLETFFIDNNNPF
ncbi:MAG: hypothetical protein K0S07_882 [Chlamydiales bacterium]|jgi:dinuclear metal center YbgI/SA1388 family protein|nr:hypothetical protein [Chlamydiales bacterium]